LERVYVGPFVVLREIAGDILLMAENFSLSIAISREYP
jgi:hypothetical protein